MCGRRKSWSQCINRLVATLWAYQDSYKVVKTFSEFLQVEQTQLQYTRILLCLSFHFSGLKFTPSNCNVLHRTVLSFPLLYGTTLHRTALHRTALICIARHYSVPHCTALHCTTLHCTALYGTALHCNTRHCTQLHWAALSCISGAQLLYYFLLTRSSCECSLLSMLFRHITQDMH